MDKAKEIIARIYYEAAQYAVTNGAGMAIFYNFPRIRPPLLIMGDNPGGSHQHIAVPDFNKASKYYHSYFIHNYKLGQKLKELVFGEGLLPLLFMSVVLNRAFFYRPNLNSTPREDFDWSWPKTCEILKVLKPERILALSLTTFDILCSHYQLEAQVKIESDRQRILLEAKNSSLHLIGISHPTGSKVSNDDFKKVNNFLRSSWGDALKKWQRNEFFYLQELYFRFGQLAMHPEGEEYDTIKERIQNTLDKLIPDWE